MFLPKAQSYSEAAVLQNRTLVFDPPISLLRHYRRFNGRMMALLLSLRIEIDAWHSSYRRSSRSHNIRASFTKRRSRPRERRLIVPESWRWSVRMLAVLSNKCRATAQYSRFVCA